MIVAFVVAHGLPRDTVDGLLRLMGALFGFNGNVLPKSKYLLRKLWSPQLSRHVKHHYYCGNMLDPVHGMVQVNCALCRENSRVSVLKDNGCFFSIMNVKEQLYQLISTCKEALYNELKKIEMLQCTDQIRDITSGRLYKNLRRTGSITGQDLTITINTDRSPVYKSSRTSVWPIQFVVNELPPKLRHQHPVLGGLWFGHAHPNMTVFMDKFIEELNAVGTVVWKFCSESVKSNVHAICCTVDAPARAAVGNHTQFNGKFGCPWCLTSGTQVAGARRYLETTGAARTSAGMLKDMDRALDWNVTVNGLKGPSPLVNLKHFDLVCSQAGEYMHCVLLGVARQLTEFWLGSSNSHEPFYIGM
ncbi:hypothetical protein V5799_013404 [Amblyomma americanum]|uniref:Uncharacterized protein n=1 Tax=Amblyomma americanum TaxID=6943 RepID=A0AAQ4E606_AMBAM